MTKIDGFGANSEAINTPFYTQFGDELDVTMENHLRGQWSRIDDIMEDRWSMRDDIGRFGSVRMYDTITVIMVNWCVTILLYI